MNLKLIELRDALNNVSDLAHNLAERGLYPKNVERYETIVNVAIGLAYEIEPLMRFLEDEAGRQ